MNRESHPPTQPAPAPKPTGPVGPGRSFLLAVLVLFAAVLLSLAGCWGDDTGQSCGETNVGTDASPSYEFGCGVNR